VQHALYHWLLLAEGQLNRGLFGAMLGRIGLVSAPAGWREGGRICIGIGLSRG
jgi:hypothetical protein